MPTAPPARTKRRILMDNRAGITSLINAVNWHDSVIYSIEYVRRDSAAQVVQICSTWPHVA